MSAEGDRAFAFLRINERPAKPRPRGITEIRGPYYTPMGKRYLEDVLETMGVWVDSLKFAGGSFSLMPRRVLRELIETAHRHDVMVSTGGFIEHVLTQGAAAVNRYVEECRDLGFDIVEISSGFITIPTDDWLRLIEKVQRAGLKAKPELGIQFGAGGASAAEALEAEGTQDPGWLVARARRFLEAGAYMIMIESEGITESVRAWRTDAVARIIDGLGLEKVMFEAADPEVFAWYVKNYGPEVNLFVDHSQIVQLECLRSGIWGTSSLWGRTPGAIRGGASRSERRNQAARRGRRPSPRSPRPSSRARLGRGRTSRCARGPDRRSSTRGRRAPRTAGA
jgi:phosphosulfolactate synthase (CoM biosynthesis protein A)